MADGDQGNASSLGAVVGIAAGLFIGVLSALGVADNLLARSVRNNPILGALVLAVAIVGAILLAWSILSKQLSLSKRGLGILALSLILTAGFGAYSQTTRENPGITLNAVKTASGDINVTAKASGSSLRSDERMLLRILVITIRLKDQEMRKST